MSTQGGGEALDRLLAAGEELLAARGFEAFSLADAGRRAGLPGRTVYQLVESREALYDAVHARVIDRLAAVTAERFEDAAREEGLSLGEAVAAAVYALSAIFEHDEAILAALIAAAPANPAASRRAREATHVVQAQFSALLLPHAAGIRHPDPELAIDMCFRIVFATLTRRVMVPDHDLELGVSWDHLVDELVIVCIAYLDHG